MIGEFRLDVPQADLDDLRDRLERTRWPRVLPGADDWSRGVPVGYLQQVVRYWLDDYDWRRWEARLNAFPQFTTTIDDQLIHFLHVRSPEPGALPLILTHGWPGSIAEFLEVVGPLTDPRGHGGDPADAFHVVAPSVPGHGFSVPLDRPGWDHLRIAHAWSTLMDRLGYQRYVAQGGDTGSVVSPLLGRIAPDRVLGVHINGGLAFPAAEPGDFDHLDPRDQAKLAFAEHVRATGTAYADLQSTKPQTISFALSDSPVGQLAWILEKFHDWTDPARPLTDQPAALDHLLTDVTLYWLTNTSATSANLYYENRTSTTPEPPPSSVPTGVAVFPTDPAMRHILARTHHLTHWTEHDQGGHFAALETPTTLVQDLRTFCRPLR
ncbi:Epoxide hydrolase domain protein [Kribbella flavida DSM 17836]|uniref:Epoxide hydrolase domain protein n=1 Tax=Kribbella flavida (strain DSM 17836 / JCM 10339 / NBRC 14399) TaxID=479435 RepID=D2Q3Q6_KRIFD|nr:epoxide hydrolase [Kribbella flavida]ADB35928.1 Epoxide hydrolase domain protein [Kribbella flavida DSM 17836]